MSATSTIPPSTAPAAPALPRVLREPDGRLSALVARDWWSWSGAHGGLVAALVADAARLAAPPGQGLRALTTHFTAPVSDAPLALQASSERAGRASGSVVVRGTQAGRLAVLGLAGFLAGGASPAVADRPVPAVPGPEDCAEFTGAAELFAFARQVEIRAATPYLPLSGSPGSELTAWLRLRSTERVDAAAALVLLDALAPGLWARLTEPVGVPTVELTAHLARDLDGDPHSGWVLARQRNVTTRDGVSVDESDLWTPGGELLAQARQLRRVVGRS